ncbi:MAG: hypothetical protein SNG69_05865 [Rikenellaceae bacterium]
MNTQTTNTAYSISYDILERLSEELTENEGNINTEIEEGNMLVVFEGDYSISGNYEEETNYSYLTHANISLTCKTLIFDQATEDYVEVANDYTDKEFEKYLLN